jgi:DDE superfamily endonuclease
VADNYATHKHPKVQAWLERNPPVTMHFTPTCGSWLNLVEVLFGIITRQGIRCGTFTSVKDLIAAHRGLHRRVERTPPALRLDQDGGLILTKANRKKTSNTRH